MTKTDFEKKIKKFGLAKIHTLNLVDAITKTTYYSDEKRENYYGCYYKSKDKKYIVFFKDPERGITSEFGDYETEEDAYDGLLKILEESYSVK